MRLDPDCVREVLMAAETMTDGKKLIGWDCSEPFGKYDADVFRYHVLQCMRYGYFIDGDFVGRTDCFRFRDISPAAHDFLANIRDNAIWEKVKQATAKAGVASLQLLAQLALSIAQAQIT